MRLQCFHEHTKWSQVSASPATHRIASQTQTIRHLGLILGVEWHKMAGICTRRLQPNRLLHKVLQRHRQSALPWTCGQ